LYFHVNFHGYEHVVWTSQLHIKKHGKVPGFEKGNTLGGYQHFGKRAAGYQHWLKT